VVATLSGGEQQMLAIGRALMALPRMLMLDEPSLGLDPLQVRVIFRTITHINAEGRSILLVEQNLAAALRISHRGYVRENGRVALEGTGEMLLRDERTKKAFLGM
jgi:branched-chain amino acid transport system ATP-binding protein